MSDPTSTNGRACEHEWQWVPAVVVVIGNPDGLIHSESFNVVCVRCGAFGWAHRGGRGPEPEDGPA